MRGPRNVLTINRSNRMASRKVWLRWRRHWLLALACGLVSLSAHQRLVMLFENFGGPRLDPPRQTELLPESLRDEFLIDGVRARAFRYWNEGGGTTNSSERKRPLPCFEFETEWANLQKTPSDTGFLFVKTFKTGSSSAAGVNLRIARNLARRLGPTKLSSGVSGRDDKKSSSSPLRICKARSGHAQASINFRERDASRSFLWSIVRDPSSRILSHFFFFHVSRGGKELSDTWFAKYLQNRKREEGHYLDYLSLVPYDRKALDASGGAAKFINAILDSYDFIAVTERMEESMVALSMILGVPLGDVLFLTAKGKGGYDDGGLRGKCTYIRPAFLTPGFQSTLDSDWWRAKSQWDRALHVAANRSLDLTIDALGRAKFYEKVDRYREAQKRAHEKCLSRPDVFPCTEKGEYVPPERTKCLYFDSGCGSDCLDEVADELGLWE